MRCAALILSRRAAVRCDANEDAALILARRAMAWCDANGDELASAAPTPRLWQYRGVALPASCDCMHSYGAMRLERSRTDSYELDGVVT